MWAPAQVCKSTVCKQYHLPCGAVPYFRNYSNATTETDSHSLPSNVSWGNKRQAHNSGITDYTDCGNKHQKHNQTNKESSEMSSLGVLKRTK